MFKLFVDGSTLRRSNAGNLHAVTYFQVAEEAFPDAGWDDFIGVILPPWFEAVTRLVRAFSTRERFTFMDGPPFVELEVTSPGLLKVRCYRKAGQLDQEYPEPVSLEEIVQNFLTVGANVVEACRAANLHGEQVSDLADRIDILKSA